MGDARARLVYEVVRQHKRGASVRAIARSLGIARKTVMRILERVQQRRDEGDDALLAELPRKRAPRPSKLDAYTDFIADLLARYPDIRATRLHEELVEQGFDGGYTIVREYLKKLRPKPGKKPRKLVLTPPGKQAQFDWSPYALADGTPIYAFSCVLSWSRYRYAHFCTDMRQATVFRELRRAFEHHGGIADEYVTDSMPGIVDRWELDEPVLNLRAVDFAAFYGLSIHVAPRGDGAYKGKVERGFRHLEESFFNARTLHTLEQANRTLAWWLEHHANGKRHRGIGRMPAEALMEEAPALSPLPPRRWDDRELAHRIVDAYCYVAFDGNRYLAPRRYVGSWVYVRACERQVELIAGAVTVVARHPRAPRNEGAWVPPPEKDSSRPRRRPAEELVGVLAGWGTGVAAWATRVRQHQRNAAVHLGRVLQLRSTWTVSDIIAAIEHAARYQAWSADAVERIVAARARPRTLEDHIAQNARAHIRQAIAQSPVQQRSVRAQARLLVPPASDKDAHCEDDDDDPDTT